MSPAVAAIIPTHRRPEKLGLCLDSLAGSGHGGLAVIVVNDGACPDTSRLLRERHPGVIEIVSSADLWWSASVNAGIERARELGARHRLVRSE